MEVKIFDRHKNAYPVDIDATQIWGINVYEYDGDEVLEIIMDGFDVQMVDVAAYTGSRSNTITNLYSIGKKKLVQWCEEREHEAQKRFCYSGHRRYPVPGAPGRRELSRRRAQQ